MVFGVEKKVTSDRLGMGADGSGCLWHVKSLKRERMIQELILDSELVRPNPTNVTKSDRRFIENEIPYLIWFSKGF